MCGCVRVACEFSLDLFGSGYLWKFICESVFDRCLSCKECLQKSVWQGVACINLLGGSLFYKSLSFNAL